MKRLIVTLIVLYLYSVSLFIVPVYADANVDNKTVTVTDLGDRVMFSVVLIHTAAETSNVASQAIELSPGLDPASCVFYLQSLSGTTNRDVNMFVQGSFLLEDTTFVSYFTRTAWDDFSADGAGSERIDPAWILLHSEAINSTTSDSAGVKVVDPALECRYIRFVSDGQTSNPATTSTRVLLVFKKIPGEYQPPNQSNRVKSTT